MGCSRVTFSNLGETVEREGIPRERGNGNKGETWFKSKLSGYLDSGSRWLKSRLDRRV